LRFRAIEASFSLKPGSYYSLVSLKIGKFFGVPSRCGAFIALFPTKM
jgi:hypothetical protein